MGIPQRGAGLLAQNVIIVMGIATAVTSVTRFAMTIENGGGSQSITAVRNFYHYYNIKLEDFKNGI